MDIYIYDKLSAGVGFTPHKVAAVIYSTCE